SAIGFYGDRQDTPVDEDSPPGSGFLAEVCRQWEAAAQPARDAGIRVVHPRIGVVLSTEGGALAKMLLPFRWGLGGPTGPGTQFMSWIALADLLRAFHFCMQTESIQGPVNFTAPHPVTNRAFAQTLAGQLQRPAGLPLPAFAVSLLFGEMGRELLLSGAKVLPKKLLDAGFSFQHDQLENALWAELKE
ncbi:MAG: TIGR01777 family oxidoreductase, partial [bacterium]|nr:TIGR01777 family oxidoreductase [bacterium]